ncbi:ficolin-1-like [Physella acuta]|uniref:ficolin-1-like n=1 Tax=Physella acuta TaxID=109671 RepID=UPI0027DB13D5|nr:ficolin-1-like [Physella acuta]XP_059179583.1 ficolin-1-like [Physella acuta]
MFIRTVWVLCTILVSQMITADLSRDSLKTRTLEIDLSDQETCKAVTSDLPRVVVMLASGLEVMCDTETEGGGWTMIQRRFDGHLDFYRGWEEYKFGFGDLDKGEFYLGNEKIHSMTASGPHELRIDFTFKGKNYYAKYARIQVCSEIEGYRLKVSGYSGNAGDALTERHNNQKFSTFDRDTQFNCTKRFHGGWWYKDCHYANLNGLWGSDVLGKGLNWCPITGFHNSATFTEMKIRQI